MRVEHEQRNGTIRLIFFRAVGVLLLMFMASDLLLFWRQAILLKQEHACLQVLKKANRSTLTHYEFSPSQTIYLRAYPVATTKDLHFPNGCHSLIELVKTQQPSHERNHKQKSPYGKAWPGEL